MLQVSKYDDPQEAAIAVVVEAYRLWLQYEVRTDDITIIVASVDGLKDPLPGAEKKSMRYHGQSSLHSFCVPCITSELLLLACMLTCAWQKIHLMSAGCRPWTLCKA